MLGGGGGVFNGRGSGGAGGGGEVHEYLLWADESGNRISSSRSKSCNLQSKRIKIVKNQKKFKDNISCIFCHKSLVIILFTELFTFL